MPLPFLCACPCPAADTLCEAIIKGTVDNATTTTIAKITADVFLVLILDKVDDASTIIEKSYDYFRITYRKNVELNHLY
ncbi:MAG: hypothetical protein WAM14_07420 [Candidatus Nitrosopolaris sp.]